MRRTLSLLAASGLLLFSALPAMAAEGDPGKVMIMKHACTEEPVRNEADFDAIVAKAEGDEITALALTVLACPTIVLADDEGDRTDGVAGPAVDFDFAVTDSNGDTQTLADAMFVAAKLCETDIERDANGDGEFSADVCLDISHYMFENVAVGEVTVEETTPPNGWKFGTQLLTPQALQAEGSDDAATGADYDAEEATVTLDLSGDADNDVMLHIYNFENSPATDTEVPETSTSSSTMLPLAGGLLLGLLGATVALRRRLATQA
jgi:LPXTG-motif cell wall-anchored protein